uniref:Sushi domain-containing protein n=1 Tax=Callorhinchus milii TaxID=7868 RepID=A0A4W3I892_CALMI
MFLRALRHLSFEDYYYYYCSVKWIGCVFRGSWRWTVGVISVAFAVTPSDSPLFWLPGQCRPVASPRFGSHSLQGGNGTNQGTKISFRCLPAYQLVGNEKILCVAKGNSTDWTGTFPECQGKTVPVRNEFGFKVAVIASIISSAIILLLSTAFLTCCLVKGRPNPEDKSHSSVVELGGMIRIGFVFLTTPSRVFPSAWEVLKGTRGTTALGGAMMNHNISKLQDLNNKNNNNSCIWCSVVAHRKDVLN